MDQTLDKKPFRYLCFLQHFFAIAFVVLWFKDNFAPLRDLPAHYLFALAPWLGLTICLSYPRIRRFKFAAPRKLPKETVALLLVLLLAVVLRIPFLASPSGLMTSDGAVPALMGKHIAEGQTPPVCYYGQLYMGSLCSHYYALAFKVFGYSIFVLEWATLLIYLGFMAVQFVFVKEVFSFPLALAVGFFYSLPLSPLVVAGLDNTSAFALVLLLGSLLLYLSYRIGFRSRENLLPALGLTIGLAFWTHQITMAFIVTSLLILVSKLRWQPWKYARLAYWAFLGFLPQLLVEVFFGFRLIPFLMSGKRVVSWGKAKAALDFTSGLLSPDSPRAGYVFVGLALTGAVSVVAMALKKKASRPRVVFVLFPLVFYLLYVLSGFSNKGVIRYLYPIYAVLPVLLLACFQFLKPKLQAILSLALVLILFLPFNLKESLRLTEAARERHSRIVLSVSSIEETGRRYWMAEYWTAGLLTAVSKEKLVVDSYTTERYLPYSLDYWNQPENDNYIFLFRAEPEEEASYALFERWRDTVGIRAKTKEVGDCRLVYDIEPRIYRRILYYRPPSEIPRLELDRIEPLDGYLRLIFRNSAPGKIDLGFWLTVEIPGFSSRKEWFSLVQPEVRVNIPHPSGPSFIIRYFIDYIGIKISASEREVQYSLPAETKLPRSEAVVYLGGIRPEIPPQKRNWMICEKESWFEVNRKSAAAFRLRLVLNSPFDFRSWRWYGKHVQRADIAVNGLSVGEKALNDGRNTIDIPIAEGILKPGANLVSLKFKYQRWFPKYPLWPIAAFLERVEID